MKGKKSSCHEIVLYSTTMHEAIVFQPLALEAEKRTKTQVQGPVPGSGQSQT